jgi:uncharacterized protein (DUF488 family)
MNSFSDRLKETRLRNSGALAAFGVAVTSVGTQARTVRKGGELTLYTVGYEKRDGKELMSLLTDQGVKALADVREKPISRKPDFRAAALRGLCRDAGIEYHGWTTLGSPTALRDDLVENGDFPDFARKFRSHAEKFMKDDLAKLAMAIQREPTALLCYERDHADCHRSILADLLADLTDATVVAL